jgi:flavin-binding protein dodecin
MSVYKVIEIIGASPKGWEDAAKNAIDTAGKSIKELRVAEVKELDINIDDGKMTYRVKMRLSFKFTG